MGDLRVDFYANPEAFYSKIPIEAEKNRLNTPFQYRQWQENLYAEHQAIKPKISYFGAVLYQNERPVLGGHFFVKKSGRQRGIFFLGSGGETDYFDLVYFCDHVEVEHINVFLEQIAKYGKSNQLTFTQVPAESPLVLWAKERGYEPYYENECACICLSGTYNAYFSGLSKSVRQNIRTANNRLVKDNMSAELKIYNETPISTTEIQELLSLYESRRQKKNDVRGFAGIKYWLYERIRKKHKSKYNLIAEAMGNMSGKFLAVYRINKIVAAYCFGLKSRHSDKICIMQVAINDDFGKYSPGMLMLTAVFQNFLNGTDNEKLLFDLTNGNEKYKFSLGATSCYTNYYKLSVRE